MLDFLSWKIRIHPPPMCVCHARKRMTSTDSRTLKYILFIKCTHTQNIKYNFRVLMLHTLQIFVWFSLFNCILSLYVTCFLWSLLSLLLLCIKIHRRQQQSMCNLMHSHANKKLIIIMNVCVNNVWLDVCVDNFYLNMCRLCLWIHCGVEVEWTTHTLIILFCMQLCVE